uniref:Multiple inositol polyphosphate phosphatase 1 n=1 Tax=Tetraselmis sp. GSL018 TaxID=582737 RepID=A0A061SFJ5_9CHLO
MFANIGILCLTLTIGAVACYDEKFVLEGHFSTKTPYNLSKALANSIPIRNLPDADGCSPSFLYLTARHGSRYPTKKKMAMAESLSALLARSSREAFRGWRYLFSGQKHLAGQLHATGAGEMAALGARFAARFPALFEPPRGHGSPHASTELLVRSTQKPRCSASAVSFMEGATGAPFSITMDPLLSDNLLRFFDTCPAYEAFKERAESCLAPLKQQVWGSMAGSVTRRLGLEGREATGGDVEALWALCQQEAMAGRRDGACGLFTADEALLLEWLQDVEELEEKAYGTCLSYQMALPLLRDAQSELRTHAAGDGAPRRAVLNFAHAETVIPLSSLLGLFGSPGACDPHSCGSGSAAGGECHRAGWSPGLPRPPAERQFRGSVAAPYGANVAHVLYECPSQGPGRAQHLVRTLYNEHVVPLPACGGKMDCPLEAFLAIASSTSGEAVQDACDSMSWDSCRLSTDEL